MPGAKDLITADNVIDTYTQGKYVCFVLKNGFVVKLDPNDVPDKVSGENQGGKHA